MDAAKALRIRAPLLGVGDGVDAVVDGLEYGIVARSERHLLGVAECVANGLAKALSASPGM